MCLSISTMARHVYRSQDHSRKTKDCDALHCCSCQADRLTDRFGVACGRSPVREVRAKYALRMRRHSASFGHPITLPHGPSNVCFGQEQDCRAPLSFNTFQPAIPKSEKNSSSIKSAIDCRVVTLFGFPNLTPV
jgi:hypothetical protein